jgi:hypothetical protein
MRYYAGEDRDALNNLSGPYVSLSRSGIPRLIPRHHRHIISVRDDRADRLVKLYLSWVSISKIVKLAKPVTSGTFKSIIDGPADIEEVKSVMGELKESFPILMRRYIPWISTVPLHKGMRWIPTWKSLPNSDKSVLQLKAAPNIFSSLKYEVASFGHKINLVHSFEGVFSPGILFVKRTLWPLDNQYNTWAANEDLIFYEKWVGPVFADLTSALSDWSLRPGKVASSVEGAGKRRLFIIGNYVQQRLLRPVHDWAMDVLARLPCDGTFRQVGPIERLSLLRPKEVFSYDLSSATDRFPVAVIHDLVACMFGQTLASCIVNGSLALNAIWLGPPLVRRPSQIIFKTGQPLGYYGSWPLTHHYLVWLAAYKAYPNSHKPFIHYALLGDDIVIADKVVAQEYFL